MLTPVEVREAQAEHHAVLGDICERSYRALPGGELTEEYAAALRDVAARAAHDVVFAAFDEDGSPVGCVTYVSDLDSPSAEVMLAGEAGMRMLAVDPSAWRRGAGVALTQACIERARSEGKQRMVLSSTPNMTAAHAMYTRLGFRRLPELDWDPVPGVHLLVFALDL